MVKAMARDSGRNCLYFYPQEYLDEAERRGLCDKDATMRHGKLWVVEDMEGVPLHQAMEDGADKARAGDRGVSCHRAARGGHRAGTVIWFCTIPERAASGFFLHFFAYPIDNPRHARYNNKVVRRQN